MTRVGKNSRMIFCGDLEQTDLLKSRFDVTGLPKFVSIIEQMQSFNIEEFGVDDIVRSGIVREYILAKRSLGIGCVLE
jgi:phosphate starvation-inducible protein PhoH